MKLNEKQQKEYDQHQLWLGTDGQEGKQLNWSGQNLGGIDLTSANLESADLSHTNLKYADLSNGIISCKPNVGTNLSKADLSYADLSRANLKNAQLQRAKLVKTKLDYADFTYAVLWGAIINPINLRGVIGNMDEIKTLMFGNYQITYTKTRMQIGCEYHTLKWWRECSDKRINKMSGSALKWWSKYKYAIFTLVDLSNT